MTHEFDGRKYEKASVHQKEWGMKLISEIGLQGRERVLDLGCGHGTLTARIADLVPNGEVVGIDSSCGMIDTARPKSRKNLRFLLMDINGIDFVGQFDVVFSNATLHWVKDHKRLLYNVKRALCDSGRLRFNFAGEGNCSNFFFVIREAISAGDFAAHFEGLDWPWYMPSVGEYSTLMKDSGMDRARVWGENADRFFPDTEAMIKWIDQPSLVPFIIHVPDNKKSAFREYVIRKMIEKTKQDDGRCFETFRRINAVARKE
jgi:trans-aconitate 2-methyltransferase